MVCFAGELGCRLVPRRSHCEGASLVAEESRNLWLLFPDSLSSYSFDSGLIIFWLETLPGKGGAG